MTTTAFYTPTIKTNITIPNSVTHKNSIDWAFTAGTVATSQDTLYTISGFWQEKFLTETSQLYCTHAGIPANGGTPTGIEFMLDIRRESRIEDLVIQLTLGGLDDTNFPILIGENHASTVNPVQSNMYTGEITNPLTPVNDHNIYGSSTDMWGTTLSSADIADPTFGIVISFRSNIIYPHRDLVIVDRIGLRITYA